MEKAVIWGTIAVYILALVVIGIVTGKKSKSVADFTVGGRNAGAWLSALSYGTAYCSSDMQEKQDSGSVFGAYWQASATPFSVRCLRGLCSHEKHAMFLTD